MSQTGRRVDERRRHAEALSQHIAGGADAECLRRIVARVKNDDSQLSCLDGCVMRSFAHDQRVESLGGGFAQRCRVCAGAGTDAPCARHASAANGVSDELSAVLLGQ